MESSPRLGRVAARGAAALLALTLTATSTSAQPGGGPVWVALDGLPEGQPADVQLVFSDSNATRTTMQVTIHGFWREDVLGPDGTTYQRLDFPGLEPMRTPGAPALPEARMLLAVGTDASNADFVSESVLSQQFVSNINVAPAAIPGEDEEWDPTWNPGPGDPNGTPEGWALDTSIYGNPGQWPADDGVGGAVQPVAGPVSGASVAGYPVAWDVGAKRLIVKKQVQFVWDHVGAASDGLVITKLKDKLYTAVFANWGKAKTFYPLEPWVYHSRYLIVAQPFWWDTLEPFVKLKKAQGYQVTLDTSLPDDASIRQVIDDWYQAGDPGMDHYCLLVGDTYLLNQGVVTPGGETVNTDDVFGCIGPINQSKEVIVGRLSVDNDVDLANQLDKIIKYQVSPVPGGRYDTALLVSHAQEYPGKYAASHTKVLNASYSHPPSFMFSYGGTGATNAQVTNFITSGFAGDGLGLVAYRGHGSTSAWTGWNLAGEDWHSNNVMSLNNPLKPIVWAITCTNGNLAWNAGGTQDCIAEVWMEVANGAVASYAATRTTETTPNHYLNEKLFKVVFDQGITTHGLAIEAAEAGVWAHWPGNKNPWCYLLLGDPSMTIRRDPVAEILVVNLPAFLTMEDTNNEVSLQALVDSPFGMAPMQDGLLSFHKASFLKGEADEQAGAFWLGEDTAEGTLPLSFSTPGTLNVCVRDGNGNQALHAIPILMGSAWSDTGNALAGANAAPAMAGMGPLTGNTPVSLLITGATPGATAWLCMGIAALNVPFKGGVLVPDINPPGGVLPLPTNELGNAVLAGTWPAGVPSGAAFFFQSWFVDASGPKGYTATNGLRAVTP